MTKHQRLRFGGLALFSGTALFGVLTLLLAAGGCTDTDLRLASTTSTRDSGLLGVLVPVFEKQNNCKVKLFAFGTGAALRLGRDGEADVVLVHARSAEEEFMNSGHGVRHEPVMHNFFLIAGPADDPAGIRGLNAAEALHKIAESGQLFVSRGDDSGTHKRELAMWEQVGGRPD